MTSSIWNISNIDKELLVSYFPEGIIALDLETTGLSPLIDRVIEISAIKITPKNVEVFETLINPEIPIPAHTIDIHHISDDMVKDSPTLNEILPAFQTFMGNMPIIAHNAKFDLGFIVMGFHKHNLELSASKIYCSCKLSRTTHPHFENHKLSTLVENHGIPLANHHRASDDAYASLRIFIEGLRIMKKEYLDKTCMIFRLNQFDLKNNAPLPKHLVNLEKLTQDAAIIEIKYNGGSMRGEFRPIKLTSLINAPDGNFVYAKCLLTDIYKSFKIKKITELRNPSAVDIQRWLKKS